MGRWQARFLTLAALWGLLAARPLQAEAWMMADDGIFFELSREGFALASRDIQQRYLSSAIADRLPDVTLDLGWGLSVRLEGLTYELGITSLDVHPGQDARLEANIGLDRTIAHAERLVFYPGNRFLETTCTNARFVVSNGEAFQVGLGVGLGLDGDMVRLASHGFTLSRSPGDVVIEGPEACSGMVIIRSIKRYLVSSALNWAKFWLESTLAQTFTRFMPDFEKTLNEALHQEFPFELAPPKPLPRRWLALAARPRALMADEERLRLTFSLDVRETSAKKPDLALGEALELASDISYATVGFNPAVINELMAAYLPGGTDYFEIDPTSVPELARVIRRETLASVWPDLASAPLVSETVRIFARFDEPPVLSLSEAAEGAAVAIALPAVSLKLMVPLATGFQDYFEVKAHVTAPIVGSLDGSWISLALDGRYDVSFEGDWAPNYEPRIKLFEKDVLDTLIATVFEYLKASSPLYRFAMPRLVLAGKEVEFRRLAVRPPWLQVELMGREGL